MLVRNYFNIHIISNNNNRWFLNSFCWLKSIQRFFLNKVYDFILFFLGFSVLVRSTNITFYIFEQTPITRSYYYHHHHWLSIFVLYEKRQYSKWNPFNRSTFLLSTHLHLFNFFSSCKSSLLPFTYTYLFMIHIHTHPYH